MEESKSHIEGMNQDERYILQFLAGTGFKVVLEFGGKENLEEYEKRIKEAGLECSRLPKFNLKFDEADLFMDLRSPECATQFDLEDWL